jgi:hypothetical protein
VEVRLVRLREGPQPLERVADLHVRIRIRRPQRQGVLLQQDPPLELLEAGRGVDPELVGQQASEPLVDAQRFRLSAAPVEREQLQFTRVLAERVLVE